MNWSTAYDQEEEDRRWQENVTKPEEIVAKLRQVEVLVDRERRSIALRCCQQPGLVDFSVSASQVAGWKAYEPGGRDYPSAPEAIASKGG